MVIDDSPDDSRMTNMAIARITPTVVVQNIFDGAAAIDLLTSDNALRPGLIFLDLKLPKVSGLNVLKALRTDVKTSTVPVVIFSSSDLESDVSQASELGANAYLVKPMDWSEYARIVTETISKYMLSNR